MTKPATTLNELIEISRDGLNFYEDAIRHTANPQLKIVFRGMVDAKNQLISALSERVRERGEKPSDDGTLSGKMVKEVLDAVWAGEGTVDQIIEKRGLKQISDAGAIEKLVDEVLAKNAKQVEDYRAGKEKAFNSLVGQVMKATQGKANPAQVNEILRKKLAR